jgi:type II secretory pathway component PulJ
MQRPSEAKGFTLIEALVSIAILAGLILMLATIFRQASMLTRQARGGAAAFQAARQILEAIGRDMSGLTRDGFLFIRTQEMEISSDAYSGLILYYDEEGNPVRIDKGRFDVLVMTVAGYHTSAVDASRSANFARVIWAQTERASGNDLAVVQTTPKYWGVNQVLARHQTLMLPDERSSDLSNDSYRSHGGSNRGPDVFNMSVTDLTRFFGPAMGLGGAGNERDWRGGNRGTHLPADPFSSGLFSTNNGEGKQELAPYRLASKVWRFGRNGPGLAGENPGSEGSGDLTQGQVDSEQLVPADFVSDGPTYNPQIPAQHARNDSIRGHERPRVFGPKDYHRIAAFGVAGFQVDWTDGRRLAEQTSGEWEGTRLQFYPSDTELGGTLELALMGPGVTRSFCWNSLSPTCIRDSALRKAFAGTTYAQKWQHYSSNLPGNWMAIDSHTQYMFSQYCSSGGGRLGNQGWPWPRAIRVRLLIYDTTQEEPIGYQFEQIFHILVQ